MNEWFIDEREEVPEQLPYDARCWSLVAWAAVLAPLAIVLGWALLAYYAFSAYGY